MKLLLPALSVVAWLFRRWLRQLFKVFRLLKLFKLLKPLKTCKTFKPRRNGKSLRNGKPRSNGKPLRNNNHPLLRTTTQPSSTTHSPPHSASGR